VLLLLARELGVESSPGEERRGEEKRGEERRGWNASEGSKARRAMLILLLAKFDFGLRACFYCFSSRLSPNWNPGKLVT